MCLEQRTQFFPFVVSLTVPINSVRCCLHFIDEETDSEVINGSSRVTSWEGVESEFK